jgi:outer membrane biogenesis lipoprotein LolB
MKLIHVFLLFLLTIFLSACASATPEEKAYTAQEKVSNERLSLIEEYKGCIKAADADNAKVEACDSFLKAAKALQ